MNDAAHGDPRLLYASAAASVHFALHCLEPVGDGGRLRACSTFVSPLGQAMHWHDFGDLEGPGWAANAIGGAHLLYRWGVYTKDNAVRRQALQLVEHVLCDGFVRDDGFVWPYWELTQRRFCLNYAHSDDWLCPGSLAHIGVQMLDMASDLDNAPQEGASQAARLRAAARALSDWLREHVSPLENGWLPRRITPVGTPYPSTPEGHPDPIHDHSADGLYILLLWAVTGKEDMALLLGDTFVSNGGFWGSLNHDTYDDHENVAYAVAFRVLRRAGKLLARPAWREFAWQFALPSLERFRMPDDRHGIVTKGLYWMEESWDTAYLWENAEIAQAHLEAWLERPRPGESAQRPAHPNRSGEVYRDLAVETLTAIAHHHYGPLGFLSEGVDWNNHVGQRHHVYRAPYGAIRYTEPLLNNLYLLLPTLTYLQAIGFTPPGDLDMEGAVRVVRALSMADRRRHLCTALAGSFHPRVEHAGALRRALPALGTGEPFPEGIPEAERPFLAALTAERKAKIYSGIGIEPGDDAETSAWAKTLADIGLPVGRPYDAPHLITAGAARAMDRYAWGSAFQEGALITAGAAMVAAGEWLDVKVTLLPSAVREVYTDDPLNLALRHGVDSTVMRSEGTSSDTAEGTSEEKYSFTLAKGAQARILSRWVGADGTDYGVGTVVLEATSGGRLALIPYRLTAPLPESTCEAWRDLWWTVVAWVQGRPLPYLVLSGHPTFYLLTDPDDGEALLVATNLADNAAQIAIRAEHAPVLHLKDDGTWQRVWEQQRVTIPPRSLVALKMPGISD